MIKLLENGTVTSPAGFKAAAAVCGIKESGNLDLSLVYSEKDCAAAAMFTQNQVAAAPVIVDRQTVRQHSHHIRAVVTNSGSANACTGEPGLANAREMQSLTAAGVGCLPEQVLVLSTGVIGVQLPMDKVRNGIQTAATQLSHDAGRLAAQGIMTTDTHPKQAALQLVVNGTLVTIGGMAKGSGMIHPNMATMLGVLTTDAAISPVALQTMLRQAVDASFNRISVDGDTSTNDTVLLLANGASGASISEPGDAALFQEALTLICTQLAQMIVRDGEGATKFVEIRVTGCRSDADAHAIAQTIATSPLVKTAFAGSDPNWGRILAAAGRAGVVFQQRKASLWIGADHPAGLQLVAQGTPTRYHERAAAAVFELPAFLIQLDLADGEASTIMWTSDLTHEYVSINADYRT